MPDRLRRLLILLARLAALLTVSLALSACRGWSSETLTPTAAPQVAAQPTSTMASLSPTASPSLTASLSLTLPLLTSTPQATATLDPIGLPGAHPMLARPRPTFDSEAEASSQAQPGARRAFWVTDLVGIESRQITATLMATSEHVELWAHEPTGDEWEGDWHSLAYTVEQEILPDMRHYYGSLWYDRIFEQAADNAPHSERIVILNAPLNGAAGYYASANEYPRRYNRYSNESHLINLNTSQVEPGSQAHLAVLTHELQHLAHWQMDANEDAWLNEGASELAEDLLGYGNSMGTVHAFANNPNQQLDSWSDDPQHVSAHYGASHLFLSYFYERYGAQALANLVADPTNGIASLDGILAEYGSSFEELFADWSVANWLDDPALADGRWGHQNLDLDLDASARAYGLPFTYTGSVHQQAADYVDLLAPSGLGISRTLRIDFVGSSQVALVPNQAHSSAYQWWSNRGDASRSILMREVDLRQISSASLRYAAWYDIETGWDYAYLQLSKDGGDSWEFLRSEAMTDLNPVGNALAPGYTGRSGFPPGAEDGETDQPARWIEESLDLTPYCGQRILLRFLYVTDDAVTYPGLCLDDLAIEAIGWHDDVESDNGGWKATGFLRTDNRMAQRYRLRIIEEGKTAEVHEVPLSNDGTASFAVSSFGQEIDNAVVVIAALAPGATQPASYTLRCELIP